MPAVASAMATRGGVPRRPGSAVTTPRTTTIEPMGRVLAMLIAIDADGVGEGVELGEGDALGPGDGLGCGVTVGVGVGGAVGAGVGVAVGTGVGVGLGVGDGVGGGAMARSSAATTNSR